MSDKTNIPDGRYPQLKIVLSKKPKEFDKGRKLGRGASTHPQGNYPPYLPQSDPVPQLGQNTFFYDLGTRLRTRTDIAPDTADSVELRSRLRFRDATDAPLGATHDNPLNDHTLEYVEIAVDGQAQDLDAIDPENIILNGANLGLQAELSIAIRDALDKAMLGYRWRDPDHPTIPPADPLDPLGFTKAVGSLRKIPNCAPIPYETQSEGGAYDDAMIALDIELYKGEGAPTRLICAAHQRPKVEELGDSRATLITDTHWKKRKVNATKDALERWNPQNTRDNTTGLNYGYIENKGLGSNYNLRVKSKLEYESFDTGDTESYKVTTTPYFSGAVVPFKFNGSQENHIYLKPKYLCGTPVFNFTRSHFYTYRNAYYGTMVSGVWRLYAHVHLNMDTQNFVFVSASQTLLDPPYPDVGVEVTATHSLTDADNEGTCNGVHVVQGTFYDDIIPGMRLSFTFTPHGAEGSPWEGNAHGVTAYVYNSFNVNVTMSLQMCTGPFAFRTQMYSRFVNANWNSVWNYTSGAFDYDGRIQAFNYGFGLGERQKAFFERVFLWNQKMFANQVTHASFQHLDLTPICSGSAALLRVLMDYGDDTPLFDWFTTEKGQVVACAPTVPYMDGGLVDPGGDDTSTEGAFSFFNAFPPKTLRAGTLLGIIKSDKVYYVWRKTDLNQAAADYHRDNFQGNISL